MKLSIVAACVVFGASIFTAAAQPAGPHAATYQSFFDQRWTDTGAPVTLEEVQAMLARQTPRQVVRTLYGSGENSRWDSVARGIARGEPAWLTLAERLSQGTDAGTSDDFAIAVGDALTRNPAGTLRLLTRIEMGAGACSENGFEVPDAQADAFYDAAIEAVEGVTDPALQQIKGQCLSALREGAQSLAS